MGHRKMKQLTIAEASHHTSNQELSAKLRLNVLLPALIGLWMEKQISYYPVCAA